MGVVVLAISPDFVQNGMRAFFMDCLFEVRATPFHLIGALPQTPRFSEA